MTPNNEERTVETFPEKLDDITSWATKLIIKLIGLVALFFFVCIVLTLLAIIFVPLFVVATAPAGGGIFGF